MQTGEYILFKSPRNKQSWNRVTFGWPGKSEPRWPGQEYIINREFSTPYFSCCECPNTAPYIPERNTVQTQEEKKIKLCFALRVIGFRPGQTWPE